MTYAWRTVHLLHEKLNRRTAGKTAHMRQWKDTLHGNFHEANFYYLGRRTSRYCYSESELTLVRYYALLVCNQLIVVAMIQIMVVTYLKLLIVVAYFLCGVKIRIVFSRHKTSLKAACSLECGDNGEFCIRIWYWFDYYDVSVRNYRNN